MSTRPATLERALTLAVESAGPAELEGAQDIALIRRAEAFAKFLMGDDGAARPPSSSAGS
jgi:hypothetical protein